MAGNNKSKRKSAGVKDKLLSNTPILMRNSPSEEKHLQLIPRHYLKQFREGNGSAVGWKALCFRIGVGTELGRAHFTDEVIEPMVESMNALCDISERYVRMNGKFGAKKEELDIIESGLNVCDVMQEMTKRREQLVAYLKVAKFMEGRELPMFDEQGKEIKTIKIQEESIKQLKGE